MLGCEFVFVCGWLFLRVAVWATDFWVGVCLLAVACGVFALSWVVVMGCYVGCLVELLTWFISLLFAVLGLFFFVLLCILWLLCVDIVGILI